MQSIKENALKIISLKNNKFIIRLKIEMNNISRKYKQKFVMFLLAEFLIFSMIGAFHIHKYEFDNNYTFNHTTPSSTTKTDLINDFFSYCSLHQFNQTVINYDKTHSSNEHLSDFGNIEIVFVNIITPSYLKSNLIPRAPPTFS